MKRFSLILILLTLVFPARAVPAIPRPVTYLQPDGTTIQIRMWGDEFYHYATDLKGRMLEPSPDGFYRLSAERKPAPSPTLARMRRQIAAQRHHARWSATGNTGKKRIPVLLVNFSDKHFSITQPQEAFTRLLNESGYSKDGATGSVKDYYLDNSDRRFEPEFEVYGPFTLSNTAAYYAGSDGMQNAWMAIRDAARLADASVDFSRYDNDGDGAVDMVLVYYAGYNQAEGAPNTIWPHQYDLSWISDQFDGIKLGRYFCTSELKGTSGTVMCGIGTTCHEFGHSLGLPDFYDTDYGQNGYCIGVEDFSLMCMGSYLNESRTPPSLSVEEKIMLGWLKEADLTLIEQDGSYFAPAPTDNKALIVPAGTEGEYFLFESRDETRWDSYLPGGLVIYHIDRSGRIIPIQIQYSDGAYYDYPLSARTLWDEWWSTNCINEYGQHPCYYVLAAPDPGNFCYGIVEDGGYMYRTVADAAGDMIFPGNYDIREIDLADWDGKALVSLSDIRYQGGRGSFTVSGLKAAAPDIGYNYIVPPTVCEAGAQYDLQVRCTSGQAAKSVQWIHDGYTVRGNSLTLKSGSHLLQARIKLVNGFEDIVELELQVP